MVSVGSDIGLAPSRQQAIMWTNVGLVHWRIYASLGLNELRRRVHQHKFFDVIAPPYPNIKTTV